MGNGWAFREAKEKLQLLKSDKQNIRGYTRIWSMVPDKPDRYHKDTRYDKFRELPEATSPVWAVAVAEVNMLLAAATALSEVHLWDLQDCELKVTLRGHSGPVWDVKFSTNESTLATASSDLTVRLWDADTGSPLGVLQGHNAPIRCLCFSFSGYLISGDTDAKLFLWEAENPVPLKEWQAHEGSVHSVGFSLADDLMALSVGADGSVAAWFINRELEDSVLGGRFAGGDGGAVLSVACHPTEAGTVAVGNQDGGVWLWFFYPDTRTGIADVTGHSRLRGHKMAVWFVEFSQDGCLLASAASDGTVRVWDVSSIHRPVLTAVIDAHDSWVRQVRFYGNHKALVTCSTDGTVSIWAAPGRLRKMKLEVGAHKEQKLDSSVQSIEDADRPLPADPLMSPSGESSRLLSNHRANGLMVSSFADIRDRAIEHLPPPPPPPPPPKAPPIGNTR